MPTITLDRQKIIKDTFIRKRSTNSNHGDSGNAVIGSYYDDTVFFPAENHYLLQFDMSEIPQNSHIINATLKLNHYTVNVAGVSSFNSFLINEPWDEMTTTWDNRPSVDESIFGVSQNINTAQTMIRNFDVKAIVQKWTRGEKANNGILLKSTNLSNDAAFYVYTKERAVDGESPSLVVEYNESPTKPSLVEPNGGDSYDQTQTIAWVDSTDPESNPITYQIQLSINNGSTWKTLTSNDTASPFVYNFINETETSQALIRVRSYDGFSYSDWSTSDGVFTIQHNVAPFIPTNLAPNAVPIDRLKTNRFSWKHNDSPNDNQTKAEINWRHQGETLWTVIVSDGPEQEYYFSPNTFVAGPIEWRVKTYDKFGVTSPWSNVAVFTSAEATNVPTIIQPTSVASVSRPIVEWTSTTQSSYQVVVEDSLGVVIWDTGELVSMVRARTIGVDLLNGGTYKVKVRVKDGSGLFSSFAEKTFTVSYTPPAKPIVQAYKATGAISLSIEHPTPTGTQPLVLNNDVYKLIDGTWTRIAIGINGTYTDHMVKSDESYQYRVVTFGDNDTSVVSDVAVQSIKLSGTWLHVEANPETLHQFKYVELGRNDNRAHDYSKRRYAGRNKPVVVFSEYEERDIQLTFTLLKRDADWQALQDIYDARQPIVYRDGRGRMLIGILGRLPAVDTFYGNSVNVTFEEVDYREGV